MNVWIEIVLIYLLAINVITFMAYWMDKRRAKKNKWRIPEKNLMFLAVIGGTIGALAGIFGLRHKSKHMKFVVGVPIILLFQLAIFIYFVYWMY